MDSVAPCSNYRGRWGGGVFLPTGVYFPFAFLSPDGNSSPPPTALKCPVPKTSPLREWRYDLSRSSKKSVQPTMRVTNSPPPLNLTNKHFLYPSPPLLFF